MGAITRAGAPGRRRRIRLRPVRLGVVVLLVVAVALTSSRLGGGEEPSPRVGKPPPAPTSTTAPAAPVREVSALGLYAGPGPNGVEGIARFEEWLGQPVSFGVDFLDAREGWEQVANPAWLLRPWGRWVEEAPGRRLVLSVPLLVDGADGGLAEGASGAFDAHFRALAARLVEHGLGDSVIRLGWEANGAWSRWRAAADPAAWMSYFGRVVRLMRSEPGARFLFDWTIAAGSRELGAEAFYPGDDVVDVVGLDLYDTAGTRTGEERWAFLRDQPYGLRWHADFAARHGKPMSYPEWGLWSAGTHEGGGGDNAAFVDAMAAWMADDGHCVLYQAYFDVPEGATGATHGLAAFPEGRAAFLDAFADGVPASCALPA